MTVSEYALALTLGLSGMGLMWLPMGCRDHSPCDPGSVERIGQCYVVADPVSNAGASGSGSGTAGSGSGMAGSGTDGGIGIDAGTDTGVPPGINAGVGQPCVDTAMSSDCGGPAPICAPLPAGPVCTQILCLPGEPNAGACPSDWPCTQIGSNPSACLRF